MGEGSWRVRKKDRKRVKNKMRKGIKRKKRRTKDLRVFNNELVGNGSLVSPLGYRRKISAWGYL